MTMPGKVSAELASAEVLDLDGKPHRVESFWAERPVLLLFVRHFACLFCREQVNELKPHFAALKQAGLDVVIIGSGSPHFARAFVADLGLGEPSAGGVPVYCDEKRSAYAAASLVRSFGSMIHPGAGLALVRALFACSKPSLAVQGDAQQQGGTFVIRPGGDVLFEYRSRYSGDHPRARELVKQALAAAA